MKFIRARRTDEADRAERLHRALSSPVPIATDPETAELVALASLIRPAEHQTEGARATLRARLMRLHELEGREGRTDGGSLDEQDAVTRVEGCVVHSPEIGTVYLADVEEISEERARHAVERLVALQARHEERR